MCSKMCKYYLDKANNIYYFSFSDNKFIDFCTTIQLRSKFLKYLNDGYKIYQLPDKEFKKNSKPYFKQLEFSF